MTLTYCGARPDLFTKQLRDLGLDDRGIALPAFDTPLDFHALPKHEPLRRPDWRGRSKPDNSKPRRKDHR